MRLASPNPNWTSIAESEILLWIRSLPGLLHVHHIGSTSVPDLLAKPIIDLLPVFSTEADADAAQDAVEAMGYEWLGEYGLPGRRYCRRDDPKTRQRRIQAHAYVSEHPDIARHLAFRDLLRSDPVARDQYAKTKLACAARHADSIAYGACKAAVIRELERQALATW